MRNPHPFVCDVCKAPKQPSNGWLIAKLQPSTIILKRVENDGGVIYQDSVIVTTWNDKLAEENDVAHLCGLTCAQQWSTKEINKLQEKKHEIEDTTERRSA